MIRSLYIDPQQNLFTDQSDLRNKWQSEGGLLWLDLCGEADVQVRKILADLGCDEQVIEECTHPRLPPKIEVYENFLLLRYRGISSQRNEIAFDHLQVTMLVFDKLLVTIHPEASMSIDSLWTNKGDHFLQKSSLHLASKIFYHSGGIYLEALFNFERIIEDIERDFLTSGDTETMTLLTQYQSRLLRIKRIFNYHINIVEELRSLMDDEEIALVNPSQGYVINELHERMERLFSMTQMYYEICSDLVNGYISVSSHQLNTTMQFLTVITAVFVPLTFLAGIYGMNFENMPELKWHYGYFGLLAVMLVVAAGLLRFFRKKRWL